MRVDFSAGCPPLSIPELFFVNRRSSFTPVTMSPSLMIRCSLVVSSGELLLLHYLSILCYIISLTFLLTSLQYPYPKSSSPARLNDTRPRSRLGLVTDISTGGWRRKFNRNQSGPFRGEVTVMRRTALRLGNWALGMKTASTAN
jgi:hypothetical protein